ncbi:MAG: UDP-N-acetylglucosamine 1-carboxyvinyltransferase [Kiritimatiellae bacterium]|nr:UDP-N-acetylglucosamine 1-carboxyvinyltransferase [Kiritimatiellia bacterium]
MSQLIIKGGKTLSGTHATPGNKNAALPMLTAALLTDEPVVLENLPLIRDVFTTVELLRALGAEAEIDEAAHRVTICARNLASPVLDPGLCAKARASILFAGPLLARLGKVSIASSGGDVIGRRRVDTHVSGLQALGATSDLSAGYAFEAPAGGLHGRYILLDEASVTATENLVMAAATAKGTTTLYNAACEPHVQDLCRMLGAMGAQISGIGTNLLRIDGVGRLHGATVRIGADYIDAGSYITAALVTGGQLDVTGVRAGDFAILERQFAKFGVRWSIEGDVLHLPGGQELATQYDLGEAIPKVEDGIWPAFPSDLMSILIVLATQTRGTTLFFEKMFESRLYFVDHLIGMGAHIVLCDPHRVVVTGQTTLHGGRVTSPDIRAGISLLIAALAAKGESYVFNAESIDRGYENVEARLGELGADIRRE